MREFVVPRCCGARVAVRARSTVPRDATSVRVAPRDAVRDTTDVSRDAVGVAAEFARDNESEPRTAADDAPNDSASATMETISFFISVYHRLAENKNALQDFLHHAEINLINFA